MTLRRNKPLRANPAKIRAWQDRSRRPLAKVGAKTRREAADLAEFRKALKARAGGRCEIRVSPECTGVGTDAHHKLMRSQGGGHDPSNGLFLCRACHDWTHGHPELSYAWGYLVRSTDGSDGDDAA